MKKVYETHIIDEDGPYTTQFETAGDPYVWVWDNLDPQLVLALQNDGATLETITDQQVWDKIDLLENVLEEA
jgi:hypothetical protein